MENTNNCNCKMCQKFGWCPAGKWSKVLKAIVLIVVLAAVANWCFGPRYHGDFNRQPNTITVTGKGEVIVVPDMATISFGVSAENIDVSKAQTESATKINKIIAFLNTKGVDSKDIKTTNYNIYPRYDYIKSAAMMYGGKQVLAGYTVSQSIEVKIRKIADAGSILTGVGEFGVTDISGLNFTLDGEDLKKEEARSLAIIDAQKQAKVLAKSLGVRLGDITSFSENAAYPMYYAKAVAAPMMDSGMGGGPALPAGENKITSNVSITYEIR